MDVLRPTGLDEALDALAAHPDATLLAGGTDLMVQVNLAHLRPDVVIGLRRVPELTEWTDSFIGSGVTYRRLEHSSLPALAQLARTVGSPQIRAAGTIGGNLGTASPAGDALPFLAAIDATVVLASTIGTRRLPWHEFLVGPKRNALLPGELILGVELPTDLPVRSAFAKIGVRQAMVIAVVSCCVTRTEAGKTAVAMGAVGPTVLRMDRAEALLSTPEAPDHETVVRAASLVAEDVMPITDHRSTAEYRRHASGVLARRTVTRVLAA